MFSGSKQTHFQDFCCYAAHYSIGWLHPRYILSFFVVKIKFFLKFFVKQLLKKIYRYDFFKKALCTEQSQILASILVEQKTGILAVFCTPLIELPIQKTLKKWKIRIINVSRETFSAYKKDYLPRIATALDR